MSSGVLVLIVAVLAIVLGLARMWRNAEIRAEGLATANEKLMAERQELTARLSREAQTRKKQADELAAQRKRADKAKKRKAKGAPDLPLGTASRIGDLAQQIERVERERDRSRAEREQLAQQVAQLEARIAYSARAAEEASSARAAVSVPAGSTSVEESAVDAVRAERDASREQAATLGDELRVANETVARMRKRTGTQEQLYASLRAELEVKKDRLRTQEEQLQRLQAFKVAVAD